MNNKGVTLEGLVITILVLIILASIAIFSGFDTVNHANTAKFVQEFADYESAVNHQFYIKSQVLAFEGNITPVDQVFAMVAGNSNSIEIPKELRGKLQGTKAYPIDVPEIDGIKTDRFGGKTYVTDIGEVFIDPEYAHIDEESEDGVIKKYANSKIVFYVKPPKPAIQDVIKVGDWIEFDTTASTETLTFTEAQTGVTTNPPLVVASTTTNWRVWKNNGDGTIDIIPGDQPVYRLTLNGEPGYDNSLDIFNAIVGAFANNSKYLSTEANGRMPTVEEMNAVVAQDSEAYVTMLIDTNSTTKSHLFWLANKFIDGRTGRIQNITCNVTKRTATIGTSSTHYASTTYTRTNSILPIVTIGAGLEINNSDKTRNGSTPALKWQLQIAE